MRQRTIFQTVTLTSRPAIQPLKLEDFDTALKSDDAFFLYLQNFDTEVADVVSCSAHL